MGGGGALHRVFWAGDVDLLLTEKRSLTLLDAIVQIQMTVTMSSFWASSEVKFCSILKTSRPLTKSYCKLSKDCWLSIIRQEMAP